MTSCGTQTVGDPADEDRLAIEDLIRDTYAALSGAGGDAAGYFTHPDIAINGSGQGELADGPQVAAGMAAAVVGLGYRWTPDTVTVWVRGDVAWARILGTVTKPSGDGDELVPYWTTAVFERDADG